MKFLQKNLHEHDDGTVHSHQHRGVHTHDKKGKMVEVPEYSVFLDRMTKKALTEWAKDHKLTVNTKKSKSDIIAEIKKQL